MCLKDVGQAETLWRTGNQRVVARRNLKRTIGLAHDKRFCCRHTRNAGTAFFDFTNVVGNGFFSNQRALQNLADMTEITLTVEREGQRHDIAFALGDE